MSKNRPVVIATYPPYVDHRGIFVSNSVIDELRLNTIMPIGESRLLVLRRLQAEAHGKKLWLDLKTRQLRITKFAYLPYAFVELSHKIKVNLPADIYFKDGVTQVVEIVNGNKLILNQRPDTIVGDGEAVNILDPSLQIEGFLTDNDREYIEAALELGIHDYMLSFVEQASDVEELFKLDPQANVICKIESKRGLDFVRRGFKACKKRYGNRVRLMVARDDLYINMGESKIEILKALRAIITADKNAVVASRLLTSMEKEGKVSLADISDWQYMRLLGFNSFLLSDGLCFRETAARRALSFLKPLVLEAP